jgi:hypothetical protein
MNVIFEILNPISKDFNPHLFAVVFFLPWFLLCRFFVKANYEKGHQNKPYLIIAAIGAVVIYGTIVLFVWL